MAWLRASIWAAFALIAYVYLLYPVLVAVLARLRPRAGRVAGPFTGSVSLVVAAYNEEASIGRRIQELTGHLEASGLKGEVIVVSDGSTDGTAVIARGYTKRAVRVVELPGNVGKAAALTTGCAAAQGEVIVFADARQTWARDALALLLESFNDPGVGAVSGELVLESSPGAMSGVGLYWRYEKWLRRQESALHSAVGVTGAISAVRRRLFHAIPRRTILDDVYWPLRVAMQGYRVVHDARAKAYDQLPAKLRDEFHRKVRTLSGNFQLVTRLPTSLLPWRNPIWFQFVSHKLLRLLVPWALLYLLGASLLVDDPLVRLGLWAQLGFYAMALAGMWKGSGLRIRGAGAAASFLVLNTAAWLAFWVWASGRAGTCWRKVFYELPRLQGAEQS